MRASRHPGRAILAVFPLWFLVAVACVVVSAVASTDSTTLRQAGELRHVTIGAAAASRYLSEPEYAAILGSEFSQLQAENEMKFGLIRPRPDTDPIPMTLPAGTRSLPSRNVTKCWSAAIPSSGTSRCRSG